MSKQTRKKVTSRIFDWILTKTGALITFLGTLFLVYMYQNFTSFHINKLEVEDIICQDQIYSTEDVSFFDCNLSPKLIIKLNMNGYSGIIDLFIEINGDEVHKTQNEKIEKNTYEYFLERKISFETKNYNNKIKIKCNYRQEPGTIKKFILGAFGLDSGNIESKELTIQCAKEEEGMTFVQSSSTFLGIESFYVDQNEVSYKDWITYGNCGNKKPPQHYQYGEGFLSDLPSRYQNECPIINVTYLEAKCYCESIGKRLIAEKEWNYLLNGGPFAKKSKFKLKKTNLSIPSCKMSIKDNRMDIYNLNYNAKEWVSKDNNRNRCSVRGGYSFDYKFENPRYMDTCRLNHKSMLIGFRCAKTTSL